MLATVLFLATDLVAADDEKMSFDCWYTCEDVKYGETCKSFDHNLCQSACKSAQNNGSWKAAYETACLNVKYDVYRNGKCSSGTSTSNSASTQASCQEACSNADGCEGFSFGARTLECELQFDHPDNIERDLGTVGSCGVRKHPEKCSTWQREECNVCLEDSECVYNDETLTCVFRQTAPWGSSDIKTSCDYARSVSEGRAAARSVREGRKAAAAHGAARSSVEDRLTRLVEILEERL